MRVLTVNCGSSSLKVALSDVTASEVDRSTTISVDSIGDHATVGSHGPAGETARRAVAATDHGAALNAALDALGEPSAGGIDAIGHRVVQGGRYIAPAIVDEGVTAAIREAVPLAPLHNAPSLAGIEAAATLFPTLPMVAVFDTAFHATLPEVAARYALPDDLTAKSGIRRYGYHGIAHRSLVERYATLTGTALREVTVVSLQLGGGCSATAVRRGVSVDTSMGFTPLEGLVMATRPGDIDPGALSYLLRQGQVSVDELDRMLNHRSGLLALSGKSGDMAELLREAAAGDERANLAIEVFCYRVRKYIGGYAAVLGDVQAVVFGGGMSRSADLRGRISAPLAPLGVALDRSRNDALATTEGEFSARDSRIRAWHIPTDEETVIARDTFQVLSGAGDYQSAQEA